MSEGGIQLSKAGPYRALDEMFVNAGTEAQFQYFIYLVLGPRVIEWSELFGVDSPSINSPRRSFISYTARSVLRKILKILNTLSIHFCSNPFDESNLLFADPVYPAQ